MSTKPNTSQITYDTGSNKQDLNNILDTVVPISDYTALRNYTGRATQVRITADGIAGVFKYNSADTTSIDNGGTIIVAGTKRWKRVFDGSVKLSWFQVVTDGTDQSSRLQAAIDATPAGATLICDVVGTVIAEVKSSIAHNSVGQMHYAVKISKPMRAIGDKDFKIKIKGFSSAWASMGYGSACTAMLVMSSYVDICGMHIDCNGREHYKTFDGYKWWEISTDTTGAVYPTAMHSRPINGITITPISATGCVEHVHVKNCILSDVLAGIEFIGNGLASSSDAFIAGDHNTGTVKFCKSSGNTIIGSRGNAILFVSRADSCLSEGDTAINCMYHAARFYSEATNCKIVNLTEVIDANKIIAKWNDTDNGYWRTNKTDRDIGGGKLLVDGFNKISRVGVTFGSAWNYYAGKHNVINCEIDGFTGSFKKHSNPATHSEYYLDTSLNTFYMSAVSSVSPPPRMQVKNVNVNGYARALTCIAQLSTPVSDRGSISAFCINTTNADLSAIRIENMVSPNVFSVVAVDAGTTDTPTIEFVGCASPIFDSAQLSLKTKTGGRLPYTFSSCTDEAIGIYNADGNYTPIVLPDRIQNDSSPSTFTFENSWAHSTELALGGWTGGKSEILGISKNTYRLRLCLNGAAVTATVKTPSKLFTIPVGLRPAEVSGFYLTDIISGKGCLGRVLVNGDVQIVAFAAMSNYTALVGDVLIYISESA